MTSYKIDKNVSFEEFEDEIIIADFSTGNYYSLAGTAALLWKGLAQGVCVKDLIVALTTVCDEIPKSLTEAVEHFVKELVSEGLLVAAPNINGSALKLDWSGKTIEFIRPQLTKYTDMNELILADTAPELG